VLDEAIHYEIGRKPKERGREKCNPLKNYAISSSPYSVIEAEFHKHIANMLEEAAISESIALLWRFVEGRPSGEALARRIHKANDRYKT